MRIGRASANELSNLSYEAKIRICWLGYQLEYDVSMTVDEYEEQTLNFYDEYGEDLVYRDYNEFIDDLTYEYVNGLNGTPYA